MTTSALEQPEINPSARVQRIPVPVASPGVCAVCGTHQHELGFADARLDFEFYGTMYLCGGCAGEYAALFGWISPKAYGDLAERVRAQETELATLRQAVLLLESSVEQLSAYRNLVGAATIAVSSSGVVDDSSDEEQPELPFDGPGAADTTPEGVVTAESDVDEPVSVEGTYDVPSTTSDDIDALLGR